MLIKFFAHTNTHKKIYNKTNKYDNCFLFLMLILTFYLKLPIFKGHVLYGLPVTGDSDDWLKT